MKSYFEEGGGLIMFEFISMIGDNNIVINERVIELAEAYFSRFKKEFLAWKEWKDNNDFYIVHYLDHIKNGIEKVGL